MPLDWKMAVVLTLAALLVILALGIQIISIVVRGDDQTRPQIRASEEEQELLRGLTW